MVGYTLQEDFRLDRNICAAFELTLTS